MYEGYRMMRASSIVLIVAIALQTVGCSTWRPLARMNVVSEYDRQSSMREQVLEKLKEGMAVRIRIREGTRTPTKGEVIECVIEEIGQARLTVTPVTSYLHSKVKRNLTLYYSDIVSIENRESDHKFVIFATGVLGGAALGCYLFFVAILGFDLE